MILFEFQFAIFCNDNVNFRYKSVEDEYSEDESDDEKDDDQDIDGDSRVKLEERDMLFESFKMSLFKKSEDGDGDINEMIPCKDGRLFK